jgi:hypothetical protein
MYLTQTTEKRIESEPKFFGRLLPSGTISLAPKWLLRARMTATAIMFTGSAFAVAADGNQLFGDPPNRIADVSIGETDCAQKIFGAEGRDFALAYIMRGKIATEGRTFDASVEMQREMASLVVKRFRSPQKFIATAVEGLYRRILLARKSSRLPCFLELEIPFVGYLRGKPFWLNAQFYPSGRLEVRGQPLDGWLFAYSGSQIIANLMQAGDGRIAHRIKGPDDYQLQDAIGTTRAYIEACSSEFGLEVDPENCRGLGGHIHIATITPLKRPSWIGRVMRGESASGGFKWDTPPKATQLHVD